MRVIGDSTISDRNIFIDNAMERQRAFILIFFRPD